MTNNPKDAVGISKVPFTVIPFSVLAELAVAMYEGARKYGRHNYRKSPVRGSIYIDATFRHLGAWWEGEDEDAGSGLSHVTKAIASLTVLRDAMMQGKFVDDRPPKSAKGFIEYYNALTEALHHRIPKAAPAITEKNNE